MNTTKLKDKKKRRPVKDNSKERGIRTGIKIIEVTPETGTKRIKADTGMIIGARKDIMSVAEMIEATNPLVNHRPEAEKIETKRIKIGRRKSTMTAHLNPQTT